MTYKEVEVSVTYMNMVDYEEWKEKWITRDNYSKVLNLIHQVEIRDEKVSNDSFV
jgi:hypothetical protein